MYKESTEEFDVFCKHQKHLYNQGLTFCGIGLDPTRCDVCECRAPEHYTVKCSSASTEGY